MAGVNKAIIVGNLGADPESRQTQNGTAVTNFRVAVSETWKDKQTGQRNEKTEWVSIVCFARLAEIAGEYLRKGSKVYIEGSLRTSSWEQDGQKRYKTEVIAKDLQMLDSRPSVQQDGPARQPTAPTAPTAPAVIDDEFGDSIPF